MDLPRPLPGIPDLKSLLACTFTGGTLCFGDGNRLVGCLFRETALLGFTLQWLDRAETICDPAQPGSTLGIGLPLNTGSLKNGHNPLPPAWLVVTHKKHRDDDGAAVLVARVTPSPPPSTEFLDRDGYLRLMEAHGVAPVQAVRILFDTLATEVSISEWQELFGEAMRRLRNINEQLAALLNSHGIPW